MPITLTAPKVGTVIYLVYTLPLREDDGEGAITGHELVTETWPTRKAARNRAKLLLKNSDISSVAVTKPIEYHRNRQ